MNDRIHLVPPTGHKRFRTSLCGVECAEGGCTNDEQTFARGTSTPEHADCQECLALDEQADPDAAENRFNESVDPYLPRGAF